MNDLDLPTYLPLIVTLAVVATILALSSWYYRRREKHLGRQFNFSKPIVMLSLTALGIIAVIIMLPVKDNTKDQLIGVFGLVLTGIIGLSSTTFVSNAMAGLMIRSIRSFRTGDFIRVGEQFGRVSARGLFHTEIQTEERDLTTLPNLYLITNPINVVRSSGTIVSATLSLGYDVRPNETKKILKQAARECELEEPFVHVLELGDFSVTYRVSGMLKEVKQLLSKRSELRIKCMDALHAADIEILSPSAVMQRPLKDGQRIMPDRTSLPINETQPATNAEEQMFDKAEEAEKAEMIVFRRNELSEELKRLEAELSARPEKDREEINQRISEIESSLHELNKETADRYPSS